MGRSHGDLDAADADAHERPDLQELETDGAASSVGERARLEAEPAQRLHQHIGHGSEPQAELVGAHRGRRGAVGEEIELALLDAVLHLAAGAVEVFIERAGVRALWRERRDDKTRIGLAARPLGLADDTPDAAPAVAR